MTETTIRLAVLAGVAILVIVFWWQARPDRARLTAVSRPDLVPGIYFFSSQTCGACAPARRVVRAELGARVHEVRYEDHPGGFGAFQIGKVPTLLVVKDGGDSVLLEGVPTRRQLRGLDP